MEINRIEPNLPVGAYQTYSLHAPVNTHRRYATCQEVDCPAFAKGWKMGFDLTDPEKSAAAKWIRLHSGRRFTVDESVVGKVILTFHSGQSCFQKHTVSIEREPIYVVRGGDWRAQIGDSRRFQADDWVDHFANHQDQLATKINQG
jgi:hypothetical protein